MCAVPNKVSCCGGRDWREDEVGIGEKGLVIGSS